jgi:hypothetical protein
MYPALLPMAVAVAVMTPSRVRKYLTGLALFFLIINQSGFVDAVTLGRARVAGLSRPPGKECRAPELMAELKILAAGMKTCTVALVGEDENFNHLSLNYLSRKMGKPALNFVVFQPGMLGLADFVIYKTAAFGAAGPDGSAELEREISMPWFALAFSRADSFNLRDEAQFILYAKNPVSGPPFPEGKYTVKKMNIGGVYIEKGTLKLSGFDQVRGVYAKAALFSPYATLKGFDIYGFTIEMKDFSGVSATGAISDIMVTRAGTIRIVSAKITNYAFERYLSGKYGGLEKIEVSLDTTAQVFARRKGAAVSWEVSILWAPTELFLRLEDFTYRGYKAPEFLLDVFKYDLAGLPYDIRFDRIKLKNQMLEIS